MGFEQYRIPAPPEWQERYERSFSTHAVLQERVWTIFDLDGPIVRDRLGVFLEGAAKMQRMQGEPRVLQYYETPDDDYSRQSVAVFSGVPEADPDEFIVGREWLLEFAGAQTNALYRLYESAEKVYRGTGCDLAEAVAYLLCDEIPSLRWIKVVPHEPMYGGNTGWVVSIHVDTLDVPLEDVREAYRGVRDTLLGEKDWRTARTRKARRDASSDALLTFCAEQRALNRSWLQMFEKWNAEHSFRYKTVQSMKNAEYAARKREEARSR